MIKSIIENLKRQGYKISFAESCTGGFLASSFTNIDGSSAILEESYICYSEQAKEKILKINKNTLEQYSVYSKEVALEMVNNLYSITKSELCISTTGLAGSEDYLFKGKVIKKGTIYIGIRYLEFCDVIKAEFSSNTKAEFKEKVLIFICEFIQKIIDN